MKYQKTLSTIYARMDKLGDLPIFSATVNRIQQLSSSQESDAMSLAMAVMKDANLSAKLLKLANSSYWNRGCGQIKVVTRAVVLLGFDRIKSLSVTLKLIESFSKSRQGVDISGLLVRAFITATMTREIAAKADFDDIEESYICGLLYGLGETIVAYTLPDVYREMLRLRHRGEQSWSQIQLELLGGHFSNIGQDLAQSWGFPKTVVQSMDAVTAKEQRGSAQTNHELASAIDSLLQLVHGQDCSGEFDFSELIDRLEASAHLHRDHVKASLNGSYKMVCDMAHEYGLSTKQLVPPLRDSGDEQLDDFSRKVAYYVHSRSQAHTGNGSPEQPAETSSGRSISSPHAQRQLNYLQEIGNLVADYAPVQQVLKKVVEAIEQSTGCQRAAFCLLSKDRKSLQIRIANGVQIDPLSQYFQLRRGPDDDALFFKVLDKGMTLLVSDIDEEGWGKRLPKRFLSSVNPQGLLLAPLSVGSKTVGFIYADRIHGGGQINDDDFRGFNQFFVQAKLALAHANQHQHPKD